MKKILILLFGLIIIAVFNITALAENTSGETPSTPSESAPSESAPSESAPSESAPNESSNASSDLISSSEVSSTHASESAPSSSTTSSVTSSEQTSSQGIEIALQVTELPKKTVYEIGETLDVTGLKVNIISSKGIVISRDGKDLTISNTVFNAEGEQQIEVKYQDAVTYFNVTVNPKHTHNYGAWKIEKEATCDADGSKVRECECKNKENSVINKLGHDWDEGEITKKATATAEGEIKYICTRCSKDKTEKIPILSEETATIQNNTGRNFKLTLKWWMIFAPVGLIVAGYIAAISAIFKKKV